ncbi:hypothetical protein L202_02922 [Cryptococcus amylolentus CBS 6039]|uniref:Fork-head domain-containing protein n=1 Tax=Cryptococcus amylolentus CBS 6039 TaxID=1295533 RepID=A0A1E3HWS7_9TREE|nr:hypothetical protein L202_02922 [Cryptococcus amylolentus CBS 6039]ODN80770.1 hypothetical protein L202_02922 [Cryptococcus amylolentus CBS 6039]
MSAADHHWQPPAPSLAALPVDTSKTDPTPAYYKLQFGDELTGFSYYVRTLTVVIGRNCERTAPVPPPAITNPSVPTNPPLDPNQPSPPVFTSSILRTPPVADFPSPPTNQPPEAGPLSPSTSRSKLGEVADLVGAIDDAKDTPDMNPEQGGEVQMEDYGPLVELAEAVQNEDIDVSQMDGPIQSADASLDPAVKLEPGLDDSLPPPPPPPPPPKADKIKHVDVDLGPLKSVSRNHAKIEYSADLGRFCLEILGRNGAWIDDRYFVKGSIVPLTQGSQIQIATRIFSFVLPPAHAESPNYDYYNNPVPENVENLPYPYNLPADEVGYQEFFAEAGPGPASAAAMAARQPPAFNAFAAADGYGLGLGFEGENTWGTWSEADSEDESDHQEEQPDDEGEWDDEDAVEEEQEESDEDDVEELEEDDDDEDVYEEAPKPRQTVKLKLKKPTVISGADDSDLSSIESEPEKPLKKTKKQTSSVKKQASIKAAASVPERRGSETSTKAGKQPAKAAKAKAATASKKESKSKKKAREAAMEIDEKETSASVPPPESKSATPSKSKPKKSSKPEVESASVVGDDKPTPQKKESKKKNKPVPAELKISKRSPSPAARGPTPATAPAAPPPVPTLAAALASTPTPTPPPTAPAPQPARPPQGLRMPGQAQSGSRPPSQQAARPPIQPGVRPVGPMSQGMPGQSVRPGQPMSQVRPPSQGMPRPPLGNMSRVPPAPVNTSPQPHLPFYLTELNETPGRPGHIIVNVPIPPSGAGPRPPPGPILGLDGKPFIGPPPLKPTATFATIIYKALSCLPRGRGTLGEVCNWVAGEWEWFRLNVDSGWQNSIRHNLSLNKAFLKVPRIPEDDPESKGSVWIIDPLEGPLFVEKQKKDAMKNASKDKNVESRREKERIRAEERAKKQREAAIEASRQPRPHQQSLQHPTLARAMPPMAKPIVRPQPSAPVSQAPSAAQPISANAKGVLQPKAPIVVVMQPITPALRATSVISATDSSGQPLPFVCDGTTLVLDRDTFGYLTSGILASLTSLGAAGAVDVLSSWIVNKRNKRPTPASKPGPPTGAVGGKPMGNPAAGVVRPSNGVVPGVARPSLAPQAAKPVAPPVGQQRPPPTAGAAPSRPAQLPTAPTSSSAPAPKPGGNPPVKVTGPAPPGTSLTKVIGMIAAVANVKGDVNIVGPNASKLLKYIKVMGVHIDLRVANEIWMTGVIPPLPEKKKAGGPPGAPGAPGAAAKPGQGPPGPRPVQGQGVTPGAKPPSNGAPAARPTPPESLPAPGATAGVKRKLEENGANGGTIQSNGVASNTNSTGSNGVVGGQGQSGGQEAKKPKLETSNA